MLENTRGIVNVVNFPASGHPGADIVISLRRDSITGSLAKSSEC
jgi:hypothetical protein